jgi:integrase
MAVKRITKRTVDALAAPSRDLFVWDDELAGFGVKMTPAGRKTYVLQYRLPGLGRRGFAKRVSLGEHGVLTPDEARKLARRELARVAQGFDPSAERTARKAAASVRELGEAYLADVRIRRKTRTAQEYARLWEKHVVPAFGAKTVGAVVTADVRRLHRSMHATPYLANRVAAMLGAFFTFAATEGARSIHDNPAHGVEFYPEHGRERFLTPEEFRRLGAVLVRAARKGLRPAPQHRRKPKNEQTVKHRNAKWDALKPANPFAVAAIRLLALTGCRENEILSLRWDAVDFKHGYLRLADTKTGKSERAFGESAAVVLRDLPRIKNNPHVFPGGKSGEHLHEIKRLWFAVRYAAKLAGVRLHDLRHSFASVPASGGESLLIIRSLLGHARVATTERYAHLTEGPVRRAADRASGDIASWLRGKNTPVTPLHSAS